MPISNFELKFFDRIFQNFMNRFRVFTNRITWFIFVCAQTSLEPYQWTIGSLKAIKLLIINDKILQTTYPYPLIQKPFNHIYLTFFILLNHSVDIRWWNIKGAHKLSNRSFQSIRTLKRTPFSRHINITESVAEKNGFR